MMSDVFSAIDRLDSRALQLAVLYRKRHFRGVSS